jgi:hypothetical protein
MAGTRPNHDDVFPGFRCFGRKHKVVKTPRSKEFLESDLAG